MVDYMIDFLKKYNHSILFTGFGLYVVGLPLASARWYFTYLVGLVLVWTLPVNKRYQFFGYAVLVIGVFSKAYVNYISPVINVKTIPIAMYNGDIIQQHEDFSNDLGKMLHEKFADQIDLLLKNPKAEKPEISKAYARIPAQCFLYDFKVSQRFMDSSYVWGLPVNVQNAFVSVPVVLSIKVEKADRGIIWISDWSDGVFFEQKEGEDIKLHTGNKDGVALKDHVGSTFFFPFIHSPKLNWIYIELAPLAVYIPLLLLLAAIFLVNIREISVKFLEHMICLGVSFVTICQIDISFMRISHNDMTSNWPNCSFPYNNLHSICNWIFGGIWDSNAGQAPLWFFVNKLFYSISCFGYLLPILCFWASAWCLLRILREFFKESHVYIIWGILLTAPWLGQRGMGLYAYHSWYILYDSLMLGMPLFLFGFLGYLRNFKVMHGLSWVAACLCNTVVFAGVSCLLLHRHLGRQRFIYLLLSLGLFSLANVSHLGNILSLPMTINEIISLVKIAYNPYFVIFGLIPNIYLAFSKNIDLKRFARAAIVMHGGFLVSSAVPQEAYLACTLSVICGFVYAVSLINKFQTD